MKRSLRVELLEDRTNPATIYALDADGTNLLRFDTATPGTVDATIPITGLVGGATESLVAIDFRPATGQLYALGINETAVGDDEGRLYTLNTTTGVATPVGTAPFSTALTDSATAYGFDINPVADAARIVNDADQNLRVSLTTGALTAADTPLTYASDPELTGGNPNVGAAAYSNNTANPATTALYAIDFGLDRLLTQDPNTGVLADVGPLGIDTSGLVGLDIAPDGTTYASLTPAAGTNSQIATIDLTTGAATGATNIGGAATGLIRDIAVQAGPTVAFAATSATGVEGGTATITVTRFGDTTGTTTVEVSATGGSATAGDYTGLPTTLTFGPGVTSQTVTINLTDDTETEFAETINLTLGTPTGGAQGKQTTATVVIADNDPDVTAPTVTINQAAGQADPATGGPVSFTVVFSEPVTGFDASDVTLTGAGAQGATATVTPVGGSTSVYTVTVNNITASGPVTATVNAGAVTDLAGNTSAASTSTDNVVTVNLATTTGPTVTINQASGQADPATGGPVQFTVTFSEPVTGFDASDVTVTLTPTGGGTPVTVPAGNVTVTGTGTTYTVTVNNVTQSGTLTATVNAGAATGAGGNASQASTSTDNTVTINVTPTDTTRPSATITRAAGQSSPTNQGPIQFTVTFSEPVTGFTASDVQLSGAGATGLTASNVTVTGSGTTYTVTVSGMTQAGPVRIDVPEGAASDAAGNTSLAATATDNSNQVVFNFGVGLGDQIFAVGTGAGQRAQVRVYNAAGTELYRFEPFGEFTGGVRVATGDFNADGVVDIAVGTGPGIANAVKVYDGKTKTVLHAVQPFEASFTGGVFVAAGDVTGDGRPELLISPDRTGGPRVRIFNGNGFTQVNDFLGIEDPNFRGGARVAVGDVNRDGIGDVLVAAGFSGGPRVAVFDGSKIQTQLAAGALPEKLFGDFFVFEQTLRNGVYIAGGDLNADGFAEIIAGGGPGGGPRVFALSGADLTASGGKTFNQLANFFAGDDDNRSGVRVAVKNLDGDLRADLITGSGEDEDPTVSAYLGQNIPANGTPSAVAFNFDPFDSDEGVYVG